MRRLRRLLLVCSCAATPAEAASEAAWGAFRTEVQKGCEKAVAGRLTQAKISVDPFGSESFGVAIARGVSTDAKAARAIVCIFDKRSKAIETSGEFVP